MTRESKIALLVGLGFIICFGVIISGSRQNTPSEVAGANVLPVDARIGGRGRPTAPLAMPLPPVIRTPRVNRTVEPVVVRPPAPQAPAVRPEPLPAAPVVRVYTVQPGDSLSRIAQKVYGTSARSAYMRIYNANRDTMRTPSVVAPGWKLRIPPAEGNQPVASGQVAAPQRRPAGRTYTVQPGDTLTAITRKTLGTSARSAVRMLHELNRQTVPDPNRLRVGTVLVIPQ